MILILKDSVEKEEAYYAYKFNDLMEIGGHYTYYEKNPSMQNYMISSRKRNGVSPSETIEDRVAKDFRSLIRSKEEQQEQKRAARMMYMASAVLILVVVIMGITTINNFDKMKTAATALENAAAPASAEQPEEAAAQMEDDTPEEDKPETEDDTVSRSDYFAEEAQAANAEVSAEENGQAGAAAVREDTAEAENGSNGVYVVEEGDTLAVISQKMYGDVGHVEAICKMNGLEEGDFIYIGQKLVLP